MVSGPFARWGFAPVLMSILAVAGFGLVLLAYEYFPVSYVWLVTEDSWGENGTFVAWLLTFVVLAYSLSRHSELRRPGIIVFAGVALFIALEEISWGQRILRFESPELFELYNRQSEFTFHNFVPNPDRQPIAMVLLVGAVLPFAAAWLLPSLKTWMLRWGLPPVPLRMWPLFLVTAWLFYDPWRLQKVDEISELFLGVCALIFALEIVRSRTGRDNAWSIAAMLAVVLVGSVAMTSAIARESDQRRWLNDFASSRLPYRGQIEQSSMIFAYLADHPELRREDTWLNFAMVLSSLGDTERATEIIARGLEEQDARLREKTRDENAHRYRGSLYRMLGDDDEAWASFSRALELDRSRLRRAEDSAEQAELHWSIARTLYALGEIDAAEEEAAKAETAAVDENTAKKIRRWLEWEQRRDKALDREHLAPVRRPLEAS